MTIHHLEPADVSLSLDLPPATLTEARERRDALARLLDREREAAADFLLALADFDRRRGWERLGHASLFAFLHRELGLSNGAAWLRLTAARLLPRFPAVESALRQGRLCLSAVGELSRVLTEENEDEVLPRFFGRSSREAREVAAAILPCPEPPWREVVTVISASPRATMPLGDDGEGRVAPVTSPAPAGAAARPFDLVFSSADDASSAPAGPRSDVPLRAHETVLTHPARGGRTDVQPLTADLRRLHVTVSKRLLGKIEAARAGLSHAMPEASTEQVLEAALDLLLEKQARAKTLVKRPRAPKAAATSPAADPRAVPAHVEREVRLRDGGRCQFPLDAGGICGSTWGIQLDHVVPLAAGGLTTVSNLRCLCAQHNRHAAELALGPQVAGMRRGRRPGG